MARMARAAIIHIVIWSVSAFTRAVALESLRSGELQQVIDAAVTRVEKKDWTSLKQNHSFDTAVEVASCTADNEKWTWPTGNFKEATGLWRRVLESGELKVGAVRWQTIAANYFVDPPTGFWPAYLQMIVDEINYHYKTNIQVKRTYYDTSVMNVAAVAAGDMDVSEPYYYLSGFMDSRPRIEALDHSCITAGTHGHFFTKKDSGIENIDQLINEIATTDRRAVGFIGQGNYDSNKALLPDNVQEIFMVNSTYMENQVMNGQLVAGYDSESFPSDRERFNVFTSGIVAPRVFLFRMDKETQAQIGDDDTEPFVLAVLGLLAVLSVILSLLLGCMVYREKSGNPIFVHMLDKSRQTGL
mmetsp:Transcript_47672/g.91022  ORF Transcript_47672/g.91022 Transcript_47672/m.91022 type:complete len:357 (+) Transcript_47672:56-1126(+)